MIKKGDKVICIKDHTYHGELTIRSFSVGKQYEILTIEKLKESEIVKSYYIEADMTNPDDFNSGLRFMCEKEVGAAKCFKDYFITLAEWRQQQIDKILEDDV